MLKSTLNILGMTAILLVLFPGVSHAYLDPGSGSLIFQMIAAGAAGIAFTCKIFWYRIKTFFSSFRRSSDE